MYNSIRQKFIFLARGTLTSTPLLTLSLETLEPTLQEMSKQFEQIIVHLPALSENKDAQLIARYLSGVIYTVQAGTLSANNILSNMEKITQLQIPIIGAILNNVVDEELETEETQQQLFHQNDDLLS